jgi:3D (Asp-Asp-Asp) domain-containing protein
MRDATARILTFILIISVLCLVYVNIIQGINDDILRQQDLRMMEAIRAMENEIALLMERRTAVITMTAYSPEVNQTDSTPYTTAFMTQVESWTVALSWDLLQRGFTPGRCIHAYGYGVYKINDGMASYWGERADVFYFDTERARRFGTKRNVKIILLEDC